MFKNIAICLFFLFFALNANAQKLYNSAHLAPLSNSRTIILPDLDNQVLAKKNVPSSGKPLRFAEPRDIEVNFSEGRNWEESKSGRWIKRQAIQSTGAFSINLAFTRFHLVGDAQLYIYNPTEEDVYGPFTSDDNDDHMQLWTPMIAGDIVIIELQVSPQYLEELELVLSRVNHDFVNVLKSRASGSCNLDVACGSDDGWPIVDQYRDIISSVGAYTLNGIDQCSGVLINNTAEDCKPYFLTADHCDVTAGSAASIVVFWNYENQECRQPGSFDSGRPGNGLRNKFNTGAKLLATLQNSDFTLIELDDQVDPVLNLHFSGWDLNPILPDTAVCIHHPNVEEKRISFEFDRLSYDANGQDTAFILVNDWDVGTTEPGSSGAPLFNTKKRIIGQLLGGLAACGNNQYDTYGWIRYSWEGRGQAGNSLKSWLDPLNLNPGHLDGRSCSYSLEVSQNFIEVCGMVNDEIEIDLIPSEFFQNDVSYTILFATSGLMTDLLFDDGSKSVTNVLSVSGLSALPDDLYRIDVLVEDGFNSAEAVILIDLFNKIPNAPSLVEPLDNASSLPTTFNLVIKRTDNVDNTFQVSESPSFDVVLFEGHTNGRMLQVNNLKSDKEYFWRVKSTNPCGVSEWSEVFSFQTASIFCTTLHSLDGPIIIPETNNTIVQSTISYPYPTTVQDVNILELKGTHDYIEDLKFKLRFAGMDVLLLEEECGDEKDFFIGFDDESLQSVINCPFTNGDVYQPRQMLSVLDNLVAGGNWEMIVEDDVNFDGGVFDSWSLEVCFSESFEASLIPENNRIKYCRGEKARFISYFNLGAVSSDFDIKAYDRENNLISTNYYPKLNAGDIIEIELDTRNLIESETGLRLELVTLPDQNTIAVTVINLIENGEGESGEITYPSDGQSLKPDKFDLISWSDVAAHSYIVQISSDLDFGNIIYEEATEDVQLSLEGNILDEGVYYLRVISQQDCGDSYSEIVELTLDFNTSNVNLESFEVAIFPNPSDGRYQIKSDFFDANNYYLEIIDVNGRLVQTQVEEINQGHLILDLESVESGIYFLKIRVGDKCLDKKLVKL